MVFHHFKAVAVVGCAHLGTALGFFLVRHLFGRDAAKRVEEPEVLVELVEIEEITNGQRVNAGVDTALHEVTRQACAMPGRPEHHMGAPLDVDVRIAPARRAMWWPDCMPRCSAEELRILHEGRMLGPDRQVVGIERGGLASGHRLPGGTVNPGGKAGTAAARAAARLVAISSRRTRRCSDSAFCLSRWRRASSRSAVTFWSLSENNRDFFPVKSNIYMDDLPRNADHVNGPVGRSSRRDLP